MSALRLGVLLGFGLLGFGLLGGACEPPPSPMTTPGELALGTIDPRRFGDNRWVDLTAGAEVELAPGAQGGFHVWVKYRIKGLSGRVRVNRIADRIGTDGTRQRVLTAPATVIDLGTTTTTPGTTAWESPDPIPSFMCPTPIGVSVIDAPIELTVSLESAESTSPAPTLARATVKLQPHCPPPEDTTRAFCLQICQG